jgi:hypothetical protein
MQRFTLNKLYFFVIILLLISGKNYAQTHYTMASGNYSENFDNISDTLAWPNGFNGTSSGEWRGLAINATGTIPDGVKITTSTATKFVSGYSGGVQRGDGTNGPMGSLILLSTGSTDNNSSVGVELYLNFTSAIAGTLSFSWASVNNTTGNRNGSLRVYASTDGTAYTELVSAQVLNFTNNSPTSGTISSVALPSTFNGASSARIRFYVCNGTGGTTGSRPKISIDNIVVTQIVPTVSALTQSATNAISQTVNVQSSAADGKVYIVLEGVPQATVADLDAAVTAKRGAYATVIAANSDIPISTTGLVGGTYYAYAVNGGLSAKGTNPITITDVSIPEVTAATQSTYNITGQTVNVQSSEADGFVYIILDGATIATVADLDNTVTSNHGAKTLVTLANTDIQVSTNGLAQGTYYPYAVDGANNISTKGTNAITLSAPAVSVTAESQSVTNIAGQSVNVQSSASEGFVYIIKNGTTIVTVADLDAAVTAKNGAKSTVTASATNISVSASGLQCGTYYAYAVDQYNNISSRSTNAIIVSPLVTLLAQSATNANGQTINAQSSVADGSVYIVLAGVKQTSSADFDVAVTANKGAKATVSAADADISISTSGLTPGNYYAYVVDGSGNISAKSVNSVTITDGTPPIAKANAQSVSNAALQVAKVQSNKTGTVYIVLSGIAQPTVSKLDASITAGRGAKATVTAVNTDVQIPARGLSLGTYYAYAVDTSGNISDKSANAIIITGVTAVEKDLSATPVKVYTLNNSLVIDLNTNSTDKAKAELYNLLGNKLATYVVAEGSNVLSGAFKGVLIVKITIGNETIIKKLLVQ